MRVLVRFVRACVAVASGLMHVRALVRVRVLELAVSVALAAQRLVCQGVLRQCLRR